jgi:hypothetical protein
LVRALGWRRARERGEDRNGKERDADRSAVPWPRRASEAGATGRDALLVGITSLVGLWIPYEFVKTFPNETGPLVALCFVALWLASLAAGIVGIVLSVRSGRLARNRYGIAGLITGIIGSALSAVILVGVVGVIAFGN